MACCCLGLSPGPGAVPAHDELRRREQTRSEARAKLRAGIAESRVFKESRTESKLYPISCMRGPWVTCCILARASRGWPHARPLYFSEPGQSYRAHHIGDADRGSALSCPEDSFTE